jgi:hypothetical protein
MYKNISSEDINVPIKEYIINVRNKYYPELDITFMDLTCEASQGLHPEGAAGLLYGYVRQRRNDIS